MLDFCSEDTNLSTIRFVLEFLNMKVHVFSSSDRPGLKDLQDIQKLYEKIISALKLELGKNNREDESMITKLNQITWIVRNLNSQHISVLNRFKQSAPDVEFPALHKELFSVDGLENS